MAAPVVLSTISAVPHRIVILGGGTAGTLAANRLDRLYGEDAEILVVDRDDRHEDHQIAPDTGPA